MKKKKIAFIKGISKLEAHQTAENVFYSKGRVEYEKLLERIEWLEREDKKTYGKWYELKEKYDALEKQLEELKAVDK